MSLEPYLSSELPATNPFIETEEWKLDSKEPHSICSPEHLLLKRPELGISEDSHLVKCSDQAWSSANCKDVIVLQAVPHSADEVTITLQKLGDQFPTEESASNDVPTISKGLLPYFQATSSSKLEIRIECQAAEKLPGASSSTETKSTDKFSHELTLRCPMDQNRQEDSDPTGHGREGGSPLPGKIDLVGDMECRVCQSNLGNESDCGEAMELGCACKDDLSVAHRRCAETWFKLKGNRICEICGVSAANVVGIKDVDLMSFLQERNPNRPADRMEAQRWWKRMPLCNLLITLIIAAILLPWMFHVGLF
ncbi:hypothetical protein O6H91_01G077100 [Diphasiastrum complanatum]|uniref:Uncharacterized protein n=1 Tax=Diphasiastrum complanatum TaxID=34168 RepID=A0ACC2ESJ5_DIPCM|nr:hypothetical protein O6H91_01G077100 [Diphasiastrum complanatum]